MSQPADCGRLVEKFVSEDKVNFILGPYGSANSHGRCGRRTVKVPMVEGNAQPEHFSQGFKYTFAVLAPGTKYLQGILEMAQTLKRSRKRSRLRGQ